MHATVQSMAEQDVAKVKGSNAHFIGASAGAYRRYRVSSAPQLVGEVTRKRWQGTHTTMFFLKIRACDPGKVAINST
jgi:hypothetical protein